MDITIFDGEYDFLSNFYEAPVKYKYIYGSAEAAYQAQKAIHSDDASKFTEYNPAKAKRMGRKIDIRDDWEQVKVSFMSDILFAKFVQNPELAKRLLDTGDANLIEGNRWHDTFWGVDLDTGEGQNMLGKLLMELRTKLKRPEIKLLNNKNFVLMRFTLPNDTTCYLDLTDYLFSYPSDNRRCVNLKFERKYQIERKNFNEIFPECYWEFHGRDFADFNFRLGSTVKELQHVLGIVQRGIRQFKGTKFFYQIDYLYRRLNEYVFFRDSLGVHLIHCTYGWEIPAINIYTGLKNSDPALDKILARLES